MFKHYFILLAMGGLLALGSLPEDANSKRNPTDVASAEKSVAPDATVTELVKTKDTQSLHQLFAVARIAQTLVSSFDTHLENLTSAKEMRRLQTSNLFCKLQRTRSLYEGVKDQLQEATRLSVSSGQAEWFAEELSQFIREGTQTNPASIAAAAHLVRDFHSKEGEICGAHGCLQVFERRTGGFPFDPLDDEAFAEYLEQNQVAIASLADPTDIDLERGDCVEDSPEVTPSRASYDWSRRNWIRSNTSPGEFVVTYDDGPHSQHTTKIMEHWERSGMAKPTFFWLSKNVSRQTKLVQDAHRRNFPIGSHSEAHGDLGNLARAQSKADLSSVNRSLYARELGGVTSAQFPAWRDSTLDREIFGSIFVIESVIKKVAPSYRLKHFRLPYGSGVRNNAIGKRFLKANVDHFFWAVDSLDWQDSNPNSVMARVLKQMGLQKRGLILFHDIHASTVKTTELLIDTLKRQPNYRAVSIKQMVP